MFCCSMRVAFLSLHGQKFVIVVKAAVVQIVVKTTKSNGEEVEVFLRGCSAETSWTLGWPYAVRHAGEGLKDCSTARTPSPET